jgi:hypothetical protein
MMMDLVCLCQPELELKLHETSLHQFTFLRWIGLEVFIIYKLFTNFLYLRVVGFIKFHVYRGLKATVVLWKTS